MNNPSHGTLSGSGATRTYTPALNYFGPDSFTSFVTDQSSANSSPATVSITVTNVNDPPVAVNDATTTHEDVPVTVTRASNFAGNILCSYTVGDGNGGSAAGQLSVAVTAVNDAPTAAADATSTAEDAPATVAVLANDTDTDGLVERDRCLLQQQRGRVRVAHGDGDEGQRSADGRQSRRSVDRGRGWRVASDQRQRCRQRSADVLGDRSAVNFVWTITPPAGVNLPPVCTAAQPSVTSIWPPSHQLVPIAIVGVTDPDGGQPTVVVTRNLQDEPTNTTATGRRGSTGSGWCTPTALVRAERTGTAKVAGDDRIYEISFTAADSHGATCTGAVLVSAPHDESNGSARDSGVRYDSTVPGGQPIGKP